MLPPAPTTMAKLRRIDTDDAFTFDGDTFVGRSSACGFRLDATDVSKQHAVLGWAGEGWSVRDLNSRNGTFVNGRRLGPSERAMLSVGTQLGFGASERWICVDVEAPVLRARTIGEGPQRVLTGRQLLAFGEDEALEATISRDVQGRWVLERDDGVELVSSGDELEICGRRWRLSLPESSSTTELSDGVRSVRDLSLRFVAPPERAVQVVAELAGEQLDLERRGHHHLTLELARQRLHDRARGRDEFEAGWIHHRELQDRLECTRNLVNVNVHRARRQLEELGFVDAGCLIERRQASGKVRIGVARLEIQ